MAEEEKLATLAEVKNLLAKDEKEGNLTYEKRLALEHAKQFATLSVTQNKQMISQLIKMERVSDSIAYKIAELLPQHPDEVRPIFAKERFTLEEDEIKQIIEITKKYL
jgi:DNA-directed RNA polymerase subunit F